jgi:RNA polymerase sigma factor (sigma-70 family)
METLSSLVIAAQGGDLEAFEKILGRFQDMAYASAYSMLNDAQLAEDVTQEAFIEAYLDLPKLREPAAFPGWFKRIVFKQSDRLIRGKHIPTMPLEYAQHISVVDLSLTTLIEERERDERVRRAVEDLPDHERIMP